MEQIRLTNLEKVYWPRDGYTKGDLVEYYEKIFTYIFPYLKDRPMVLNRFPDGIKGKAFYQKDMRNDSFPSWLSLQSIYSESEDKHIQYVVLKNKETLIYLAQLGCIEMNPWNSRVVSIENPDYLVLDYDPEQAEFSKLIDVVLVAHNLLNELQIPHFPKTSGARGLHIYMPLGAGYSHSHVQGFAKLLNQMTYDRIPDKASLIRNPGERIGKIYLDYLQNGKGKTLVAPYSLRPVEGALVSTPLEWSEVTHDLDPRRFHIRNIFDRLKQKGDLWKGVLDNGIDIEKSLMKIENIIG